MSASRNRGGRGGGVRGHSALVRIESCAEDMDVLFVQLANFAVLGLEVVEEEQESLGKGF